MADVPVDDTSLYPRFSPAELAGRYARVRAMLAREDLDGLVVFGWSALGRAVQADVHYLSCYLGMRDNYVLFPAIGEPVLFVQSYNHVPNARAVSTLDDVRWGGTDSGATLGREVAHRALRRVGVVGLMPYQHHARLRATAPAATFHDVTAAFRRLRVAKSAEELAWIRRGAAFTDAALAAMEREMRPGIREFEIGEIIEHAYLRQGGLTTFYYVASTPMASPDRCVPAQVLSSRRIQPGDVVTCEVSASYGGYAGQGLRTFVVGAEPAPLYRDLHEVAELVYDAALRALRPGATAEDLLDAAELIAERGYTIRDGLAHGFGIGLLPPAIGTRQTGRVDEWTFEPNQTIVIQPNPVTLDERAGVQTGNLCLVTSHGAESLQRFPLKLVPCGV